MQMWLKKIGMNFYCFRFINKQTKSINFTFGTFEIRQFKTNCSGLKTNWGSPTTCSYLQNAYYVITFCCFTHVFCRLGLQLTMPLYQACNLLWPNNFSGNLTDDLGIISYLSLNKSPNCAMCTSLRIVNETGNCHLLIILGCKVLSDKCFSAYSSDATTGNISDTTF